MKTKLALAALAILALAACNQTPEQMVSVKNEGVNAASIVGYDTTWVSDTTWLTEPKNGGNNANDYCDNGMLIKPVIRRGDIVGWDTTGNRSQPHAQCIDVKLVVGSITPIIVPGDEPVSIPNKPPVAVASVASALLECSNYGASAGLNGSASHDEDGNIVSYQWFEGATLVGTGVTASAGLLGLGTHTLTLVVTDDDGATGSATVSVLIQDTQAPVVTLNVTPGFLWSPNHKYVAISSGATATDVCASIPSQLVASGSVVSNELDNAKGDGNTTGDVKVTRVNGSISLSSITAPSVAYNALTEKLELRSERSGNLQSRVYSISLSVKDPSGNIGSAAGAVVVPHNK